MSKLKLRSLLALVFISGLLFYCYEFYLRILPGAYADNIMSFFHIGPFDYSFLVSSYNTTYLAMQIPAGLMLDHWGNRKVLVTAILLCGIGNIVFISDSYYISIIGRLLIGFGASFAFVGVLKLCREFLSERYFAFLASIVISIGTLAAAYAQEISTIISNNSNWRGIFIYSGFIAILFAVFIWLSLTANKNNIHHKRILPSLNESLKQIFILAKNKYIWLTAIIGGLLYAPTVVLTAQWGVYFFKHDYGLSQQVSASAITNILLGWVVFSPVVGFVADRFAKEKLILGLFSIIAASILFILMYCLKLVGTNIGLWVFLFGCASASQVLIWKFFNQICPMEYTGIGIAITNMLITFLTELFQLIIGALMEWHSGILWFAKITSFTAPIQFASISLFFCIALALILLPFLKIKRP